MNYKNRLYQVVENYIAKVGEIDAAEKNLWEQEQRETISRVHADERRAEYQKQRSESCRAVLTEIGQIRADHAAAVDTWNAMDGEKLHTDAEILKLDIPMNQAQFQQLCEKHKDNSLMLSLLCQYADRPLTRTPENATLTAIPCVRLAFAGSRTPLQPRCSLKTLGFPPLAAMTIQFR